ncbi:MAG: hypothetical protein ACRDWI_16575 [Jiangellaceae bacterium]
MTRFGVQFAAMVRADDEAQGAGGGHAWVLSDLKSLLETGKPLAGREQARRRPCSGQSRACVDAWLRSTITRTWLFEQLLAEAGRNHMSGARR